MLQIVVCLSLALLLCCTFIHASVDVLNNDSLNDSSSHSSSSSQFSFLSSLSLSSSSATAAAWLDLVKSISNGAGMSSSFVMIPITALLAYWLYHKQSATSVKSSKSIAGVVDAPSSSPSSIPQHPHTHCTSTDTDIVIVGAGVAGASLGAALVSRGFKVVVVEQCLTEPNRIVGELLQPSGVALLQGKVLNLAHALEGFDAQPVLGYSVFSGAGERIQLDYPLDPSGATCEGRSFHNGRFLMALRRALVGFSGEKFVDGADAAVMRQGTVTGLMTDPNDAEARVSGISYRTRDGVNHTLTAALTVVCDGLFSALRPSLVSNTFQTRSKFLGLILEDAVYPTGSKRGGNVILADPTPILLYPISSTEGRMLIDFPDSVPVGEKLVEHLLEKTMPQLPASLHASFTTAVKQGKFQQMPNRQLGARPVRRAGTLMVGDAMNVRHPLTGGGMTVALTDVASIVQQLTSDGGITDFNDFESLDALVAQHYATRSAPVAAINILADALYDVFGSKYADLRDACFDYMKQGGEMSAGPIRLLSGVSRSQLLLVGHFFAVALWGVWRFIKPVPTFSSIKRSVNMIRDALIIILPLLLQEHPGLGYRATASVFRIIFWIPYTSFIIDKESEEQ